MRLSLSELKLKSIQQLWSVPYFPKRWSNAA